MKLSPTSASTAVAAIRIRPRLFLDWHDAELRAYRWLAAGEGPLPSETVCSALRQSGRRSDFDIYYRNLSLRVELKCPQMRELLEFFFFIYILAAFRCGSGVLEMYSQWKCIEFDVRIVETP